MVDLLQPTLEWATATGLPNWVFIVALLTAPHLWARQIKNRVTPLIDRYLPGE